MMLKLSRKGECQAKSQGTGIPNTVNSSCKEVREHSWLLARSSRDWVWLEHVGK